MCFNGVPFLANPFTLGLAMNIDWFQPHKHTESSVGAIYMTVMNLPHNLRFKREFMICLGIIPGPKEPKRDINSYLRPLVGELLDLWDGVCMNIHGEVGVQKVRCALLCVACDMPASRKVCGFLSHTAKLGCPRCRKEFPGSVGSKDYSGFSRDLWIPRTRRDHYASIEIINKSRNKTERNELESRHGCRYSVLLDLPYFDPVRMTIVDPMHNLFLGSAKHMMKKVWIKKDLVTLHDLEEMQKKMDSMKSPSDVGRIPRKLETGFSNFTADQLKNWVNLYSIPCLHNVLSTAHLKNWRHFVLGCRILCQHSITLEQIAQADGHLLEFCKGVQTNYGKEFTTPNMHMHCHLREVLLDYGPVYNFWCFCYERYNGILGNQPNNNKAIEPQLMQRFLADNSAYSSLACPSNFKDDFNQLCMPLPRLSGSLLQTMNHSVSEQVELPKFYSRKLVPSYENDMLVKLLAKIRGTQPANISVNSMARQYSSLSINENLLSFPCVAMLDWDDNIFGARSLPHSTSLQRSITHAANVEHAWQVAYECTNSGNLESMLLMQVNWYKQHPSFSELGKPAQIWYSDLFETPGLHSFVPLHLYHSRCIHLTMSLSGHGEVLVVVPLVN